MFENQAAQIGIRSKAAKTKSQELCEYLDGLTRDKVVDDALGPALHRYLIMVESKCTGILETARQRVQQSGRCMTANVSKETLQDCAQEKQNIQELNRESVREEEEEEEEGEDDDDDLLMKVAYEAEAQLCGSNPIVKEKEKKEIGESMKKKRNSKCGDNKNMKRKRIVAPDTSSDDGDSTDADSCVNEGTCTTTKEREVPGTERISNPRKKFNIIDSDVDSDEETAISSKRKKPDGGQEQNPVSLFDRDVVQVGGGRRKRKAENLEKEEEENAAGVEHEKDGAEDKEENSSGRMTDQEVGDDDDDEITNSHDEGKFLLIDEAERFYKRFNTVGMAIRIKLRKCPPNVSPLNWIEGTLTEILEHIKSKNVKECDHLGMTISTDISPEKSIGISFRRADQLSPDVVFDTFAKFAQSNDEYLLSDQLIVTAHHIIMPVGRGKRFTYPNILSFEDFCRTKKSIILISNDDSLCLARALAVALSRHQDCPSVQLKVRKNTGNEQSKRALELCKNLNVNLENGGGIEELKAFQEHLSDFTVTVFSDRKGRSVIFAGPDSTPERQRKNIDLIYENGHFNVITSVTGAFSCSYYCRKCRVPYNQKGAHRCNKKCPCCHGDDSCSSDASGAMTITCDQCKRKFMNIKCFENHKKLGKMGDDKSSVCERWRFCPLCSRVYGTEGRTSPHVCGEIFCAVCKCSQVPPHFCFMQPDEQKVKYKGDGKVLYVFYDFECRQDKKLQNGSFEHQPILCVVQQACSICYHVQEAEHICHACGCRQNIFDGNDPVSKFFTYLTLPRKNFKEIVVVAHNMKGYDGQFILSHMTSKLNWKPSVLMTGTKIISMQIDNLKFIDSLNFMPMSLAKLPKAFGLSENLKKGYFPHFFCDRNYSGALPPKDAYGANTMSENERQVFDEWYENQSVFHYEKELREYCVVDVTILRLASLKFCSIFFDLTKVNPFRESFTVAGACMLAYKRNFLTKDTVGIVPPGGYRWKDRQSHVAVLWLLIEEKKRGAKINHAGNGHEANFMGRKVDGYLKEGDRTTIFEFYGCYYHGCPKCFENRDAPISNSTGENMRTRYESTMRKREILLRGKCDLIEIWECEFQRLLNGNPQMKAYAESNPFAEKKPLDPRDAFFGGRTNAGKMYHSVARGEKIKYVDVCSLYPYVNKWRKYPVGHPKIFVGEEIPTIDRWEGLIKCTILPPRKLYHPVLPYRWDNKLTFPLCRTCVQQRSQNDCVHDNESDRWIVGTWVTDEVKAAVRKGYKIIDTAELWQYDCTKFDKAKNSGGLFSNYINTFLKIKMEASGWPSEFKTKEERVRWLESVYEKEGVRLDESKIEKNEGLRSIVKLILNSLWGKFGQRDVFPKTEFISDVDTLYDKLTDPNIEVTRILPVSETLLCVCSTDSSDALKPNANISVPIACYTTAHARLELFEYLDKLGPRALYWDTDSVLFVENEGDWSPELGTSLGEMTDELSRYGEGSYITEFVSGGPKNYSYKVACKVTVTIDDQNTNMRSIEMIEIRDESCSGDDDVDDDEASENSVSNANIQNLRRKQANNQHQTEQKTSYRRDGSNYQYRHSPRPQRKSSTITYYRDRVVEINDHSDKLPTEPALCSYSKSSGPSSVCARSLWFYVTASHPPLPSPIPPPSFIYLTCSSLKAT
ncbi:uncharacterized protein LOC124164478 [Ischnura elegans]|uniref:uncharacterized protein LOC124164478 n=1 Tax=Ischnura elegans TaxID=197161 RepID=UPI001ED8AE31|nr:uncharacterized protein LOC124164478 [Ischnura elegans]